MNEALVNKYMGKWHKGDTQVLMCGPPIMCNIVEKIVREKDRWDRDDVMRF